MSDEVKEEQYSEVIEAEDTYADVEPELETSDLIDADQVLAEDEAEILRQELSKLEEELERAKQEVEELKKKNLRTVAEAQTIRRRVQQDIARAKDQGADSVILTVLPVYDDLHRALEAAGSDPAKIVPGVEQVRETLKRNLGSIGLKEVGLVGEVFDPQFHEALTAVPAETEDLKGTIAKVFESGFVKDNRVVRVARVVVYQD